VIGPPGFDGCGLHGAFQLLRAADRSATESVRMLMKKGAARRCDDGHIAVLNGIDVGAVPANMRCHFGEQLIISGVGFEI